MTTGHHRHPKSDKMTCKGMVYTLLREDGASWTVEEIQDHFKREPADAAKWAASNIHTQLLHLVEAGRVSTDGGGPGKPARFTAVPR